MAPRDEEFEQAFDELYAIAWRAALRILGEPTAAQDVAAETLTRAYVRWPTVVPFAPAWVVRTVTNLAIDGWRRRRWLPLPEATETSISMVDVDHPGRSPRALALLPEFSNPLSLDPSGQHLLYQARGGLFRRSIVGEAAPVRFDGEYLSASW